MSLAEEHLRIAKKRAEMDQIREERAAQQEWDDEHPTDERVWELLYLNARLLCGKQNSFARIVHHRASAKERADGLYDGYQKLYFFKEGEVWEQYYISSSIFILLGKSWKNDCIGDSERYITNLFQYYMPDDKKLTVRFSGEQVKQLAQIRAKFNLNTDNAAFQFLVENYANLHDNHERAKRELRELRQFRDEIASLRNQQSELKTQIEETVQNAQNIKESVSLHRPYSWD